MWDDETLQTISNEKMNIFQMKMFNKITLLLFVIYSFIIFKVLVSLTIAQQTILLITVQLG